MEMKKVGMGTCRIPEPPKVLTSNISFPFCMLLKTDKKSESVELILYQDRKIIYIGSHVK